MKDNEQSSPDVAQLEKRRLGKLPRARLIEIILEQREDMRHQLEEKDQRIAQMSEQLAQLQGEMDKEKAEKKIKEINQHAALTHDFERQAYQGLRGRREIVFRKRV
ncbi:MAG: hypothetical protein GY726_11750 [Proteobacteria bacterium]|nr:hypothetical protein [Pseudomonadota bacterium]